MCDCSGLSGRVLELEANVIGFPTASDWSALAALNSSRFNSLNDTITSISNRLLLMETYVTNLRQAHVSLNSYFTGHTGVVARSGHRGGLTGELL